MVYGRRYGKSSRYTAQGNVLTQPNIGYQSDYFRQQSGSRRHQYTANFGGNPSAILPNEYIFATLLRFKRSFTGTPDTPPTPTDRDWETDCCQK